MLVKGYIMIKVLNTSLFFMLFTCCYAAHGGDDINGAFGLAFGDVTKTSQAKKFRLSQREIDAARLLFKPSIFNDDRKFESFEPSIKTKPFIKYTTKSTSLSNRIYTIIGESASMSRSGCLEEKDIIGALLEEKYNMRMTRRGVATCPGKYYSQNKASVFVSCDCGADNKLTIKYYHDDFALLDYAERRKIIKDKKDAQREKRDKRKQQVIEKSKNRSTGGL